MIELSWVALRTGEIAPSAEFHLHRRSRARDFGLCRTWIYLAFEALLNLLWEKQIQ